MLSLLEVFGSLWTKKISFSLCLLSPVDRIQFLGVRYEATPAFSFHVDRVESRVPTNKQQAFSIFIVHDHGHGLDSHKPPRHLHQQRPPSLSQQGFICTPFGCCTRQPNVIFGRRRHRRRHYGTCRRMHLRILTCRHPPMGRTRRNTHRRGIKSSAYGHAEDECWWEQASI